MVEFGFWLGGSFFGGWSLVAFFGGRVFSLCGGRVGGGGVFFLFSKKTPQTEGV